MVYKLIYLKYRCSISLLTDCDNTVNFQGLLGSGSGLNFYIFTAVNLKKVINQFVAFGQTTYVKGRYIGESFRVIQDLTDFTRISYEICNSQHVFTYEVFMKSRFTKSCNKRIIPQGLVTYLREVCRILLTFVDPQVYQSLIKR